MRSHVVGKFVLGAALSGALLSSAVHAESMRCGKWVVNESATVAELVNKCGQPQSRDVQKEDQYATNPNGARFKTGVQTVKERWVYRPTPGTLPMAVLIVDGKIVAIARVD